MGPKEGYFGIVLYWLSWEYVQSAWGWPMLNLGNALSFNPSWAQWYEFTGGIGGTLWVLTVNLSLFFLFKRLLSKKEIPKAGVVIRLLFIMLLVALPVIFSQKMENVKKHDSRPFRVVQTCEDIPELSHDLVVAYSGEVQGGQQPMVSMEGSEIMFRKNGNNQSCGQEGFSCVGAFLFGNRDTSSERCRLTIADSIKVTAYRGAELLFENNIRDKGQQSDQLALYDIGGKINPDYISNISRKTAIEQSKPMIGLSSEAGIVIDEKGKTVTWFDCTLKSKRSELKISNKRTFFDQHGNYIGRVASFVSILLLLLSLVRSISDQKLTIK